VGRWAQQHRRGGGAAGALPPPPLLVVAVITGEDVVVTWNFNASATVIDADQGVGLAITDVFGLMFPITIEQFGPSNVGATYPRVVPGGAIWQVTEPVPGISEPILVPQDGLVEV